MESPERNLQAIFDHGVLGIAQIGIDGSWLRVNDRYCQMLGYSESELRTKRICDITHPDDSDKAFAGRRQLLEGAISSHSMEKRYIRRDGTVFWGRLHRSLVRDHDNVPRYFIAVVEDITERKRTEDALQISQERLELAQRAGGIGIWDWDAATDESHCSSGYGPLYGLPPGHRAPSFEGWLELVSPEDRVRLREELSNILKRDDYYSTEFRVVWPDGTIHWLLGKGQVFRDSRGDLIRMIGVNMDISERKRAEAALSESEERFRTMADTAPVMLWVTGPDKRATFFNKSCMDFTGHSMEQKLGDGWVADLHPEDREQFLAVFSSSNDARQEFHTVYRLRRADGEYRWVLHTGVPRFAPDETFAGYIGSCIDITELRRSQQEALARQKLEDLGVLARGIAHDFNNLLGSILAEAELVEDELAEGLSPDDGIARIKTVAIRGAEIVRELMIYAGQDQTNVVEQVDLSRLAAEMLELMKVSISKNVVLKLELDKNLPAVLGSASQIRQVLMNLVINASEAIGEKEGTIQVTTSRVTGGDYVRLEVSDSGCGLTEEARAKIFDPFYTTKFAGRGLGLAVVQGIVRAHNGTIDVVSLPGQGATFRVLLACSSEAQNTITSSGADRSHARTNGTVLVVEDEEVLRLAVSKGLRRRGFSVIEAKDGSVAMNLMRTHIDEIDVILLDLTLPGASSREVFEEAKRMRTNLKVVLTSAYDRRTVDASFPGLRLMQFIRKPFQLDDLAGTLRDALAS